MPKAAFSVWHGRIAPLFDVSGTVQIVDAASGAEPVRTMVDLPRGVGARMALLRDLAPELLVCGAISRQLLGLLSSSGLPVKAFVTGELEEVIRAWLDGHLGDLRFRMPGCPVEVIGRRMRRRGCRRPIDGRREDGDAGW